MGPPKVENGEKNQFECPNLKKKVYPQKSGQISSHVVAK